MRDDLPDVGLQSYLVFKKSVMVAWVVSLKQVDIK